MAQQSAKIHKIWLEHGVTQNSQQGVQVHLNVQTIGFRGVDMVAIAYLEHPKGVGVRDTNGKYCTSDGAVAFTTNFTPRYDDSTWEDMRVFIPYGEMHLLEGSHTYYCRVFIFKVGSGAVTHSDFVEFQGTVSTKGNNNSNNNNNNNNNHNSNLTPAAGTMPDNLNRDTYYMNSQGHIASIRTSFFRGNNDGFWRASVYYNTYGAMGGGLHDYKKLDHDGKRWIFKEYSNFGYKVNSTLYIANDWSYIQIDNLRFDIPITREKFKELDPKVQGNIGGGYNNNSGGSSYNNNDSGRSYIDGPCKYCGGGGGCRSCNGRGYKYNPYSGHDDTCPSCNGSGRCFNCRGTGKQATY